MNIQAARDYLKENKVAVECSNEREWDEMKEVTGFPLTFWPAVPCMGYTARGSRSKYEARGYIIIPFSEFKEMFTEGKHIAAIQQALKAYNKAHDEGWGLLLEDDGSCGLYNAEIEEYHPKYFNTIEECIKWLQDNTSKSDEQLYTKEQIEAAWKKATEGLTGRSIIEYL